MKIWCHSLRIRTICNCWSGYIILQLTLSTCLPFVSSLGTVLGLPVQLLCPCALDLADCVRAHLLPQIICGPVETPAQAFYPYSSKRVNCSIFEQLCMHCDHVFLISLGPWYRFSKPCHVATDHDIVPVINPVGRQCSLPAGYCKGQTCCRNGTICRVSTTEGYECECPDVLYGSNCRFIAPCALQPCQNGGTCNVSVCVVSLSS